MQSKQNVLPNVRRETWQGKPITTVGQSDERPGAFTYANSVFLLIGLFLGLVLLKFGNPVIFEGRFPPPGNFTEALHFSWPASWGWLASAVLFLLAMPLARWKRGAPRWLLISVAAWLAWQWVASFNSIDPQLSRQTVIHFSVAVGWFAMGLLATRQFADLMPVWLGLAIGVCLVISTGFDQQFGGLEETRVFYEKLARGEHVPEIQRQFESPELRRVWESPLFQFKVTSRRIYSTLFYPNTLAGVLLMLTPPLLGALWIRLRTISPLGQKILPALIGLGAALCLVWSGSKAGWLIALIQSGILFLGTSIPLRWRRTIALSILTVGLAVLVARNLDYFQRGARSVSARTNYWAAAVRVFLDNPVTGTGPGTFGKAYRGRKSADSEMAWLAHNDYIQQASDSGLIGALGYLAFVGGSLYWLWRLLHSATMTLPFLTWLGLLAWAIQSLSEFGLYVPAIAWPAFFLVGSLVSNAAIEIDKAPS